MVKRIVNQSKTAWKERQIDRRYDQYHMVRQENEKKFYLDKWKGSNWSSLNGQKGEWIGNGPFVMCRKN